mgnify:CR=1 FL=1
MEFVSCNLSNFRAGRTQPVRYIVMHYTANNGDTARNNCDYYHRVGGLQASAHYFCDEHGTMQSVREGDTAWHCGAEAGQRYWHPECRNGNSIGIEMCSRKRADGSYYIKPETVANAAALAREIMQRYGIDTDHVLRHYDVTGKRCPMPWVDDPAQWTAFKDMLKQNDNDEEDDDMVRYNTIEEVPSWAQDTVRALVVAGALGGVGGGNLDLSMDMIRGFVVGTKYAAACNPRYETIDDMPEYYRKEAQKLVDRGALRGVGGGDLNVSEDALRSMIVCQRMIDSIDSKEGES